MVQIQYSLLDQKYGTINQMTGKNQPLQGKHQKMDLKKTLYVSYIKLMSNVWDFPNLPNLNILGCC